MCKANYDLGHKPRIADSAGPVASSSILLRARALSVWLGLRY